MSSQELAASEPVCYVLCNFCNTILVVSVPASSLYTIVSVRCGHCANLLSVNMGSSLQTLLPLHHHHRPQQKLHWISEEGSAQSSTKSNKVSVSTASFDLVEVEPPPIRPPEKRQRVPSAYNRFIKEEIHLCVYIL